MAKLLSQNHKPIPQWCFVSLDSSNNLLIEESIPANTWVRLLEPLNPYSDEEALILCQHSDSEWVAWIPNYGEAILHVRQFCLYA
jgi:hypothetical protein